MVSDIWELQLAIGESHRNAWKTKAIAYKGLVRPLLSSVGTRVGMNKSRQMGKIQMRAEKLFYVKTQGYDTIR